MLLPFLATLPLGPWDLVRVDVPDHPDAVTTSRTGSVLLAPPDDLPWRVEAVAEIDRVEAPDGAPDALEQADSWQATEAIEALDVAPWHAAGFDGAGVKVAVFDIQWFGTDLSPHAEEMAPTETHDCFRHPSCEAPIDPLDPTFGFEGGGHGTACAQIIRDVAPGVELHLVRVSSLTTLENAVDWAIREGVDLVSMSMSFFNEGFYDGTGAINDQMDHLAAAGVLMVTSAGNYAGEHYVADFSDVKGDDRHDFPWGTPYLPVEFGSGSKRVNLVWDDFTNCGDTDLDIYAYDADGNVIGRSTGRQERGAETCSPVERLTVNMARSGTAWLVVHRAAGSPNVAFDLIARGGDVTGAIPQGSVTDPGNHPAVFTVGAIRADARYGVNSAEGFSSHGPTHAGLDKPDVGGPNGLTSTIYGVSGFYGTSAATPAVAGALAVLMSADPTMDGFEAADVLKATALRARDVGAAPSTGLGAGAARLPPPDTLGQGGCGGGAAALLLPLLGLRRRPRRDTLAAPTD